MLIAVVPVEGSEVFRYVREFLSWDDSMSVALRGLPIEQGKCFVVVPRGERVHTWSDLAGVNPVVDQHERECRARAVRLVDDYLQSRDSSVALFATLALQGDVHMNDLRTSVVLLPAASRRSVYLMIQHKERTIAAIDTAFREARPFTTLVILTSYLERTTAGKRPAVLNKNIVKGLAARTACLLVSALDDSTYLVWVAPSHLASPPFSDLSPTVTSNVP